MKRTLIAIIFMFLPTSLEAQDEIIIPTEMCRNYFFVPIVLSEREGRDQTAEGRTLWMLYDTGASHTYVDPDALSRAANIEGRQYTSVDITNATMGPLTINRLPTRIEDLDHLSIALGRQIDGILGYGFFADFLMTLDYQEGLIRLATGELPRPNNEDVFSTRGPDSRPFLRLRFPERARRVLIDSGAAGTALAVTNLHRYDLEQAERPIGASIRFSHIEYRDGGRLAGDVALGHFVFERPLLEEVPETELLGGMLMQHFNWTFDQANDRVRIEQFNGRAPISLPAETTHGLALTPEGTGVVVNAILPGSLAGEAGLQVGDLLTHFDGLPIAERGCGATDTARQTLTVTRVRDGEAQDITFPLVTLID